ncbi:MAG: SpoIIE family protein phosphatase [Oligoflexia bacterium]|nr:SpoIIE family protein phosphatase [Oligoflexia bacterium]
MALLAASLGASLWAYLWIATSLLVEDKTSYLFEHNLAELRSAAEGADNAIRRAALFARWLESLASPAAGTDGLRATFERGREAFHIQSAILLKPAGERFEVLEQFLPETRAQRLALPALPGLLGWTPARFPDSGELIGGKLEEHLIPIGVKGHAATGEPLMMIVLLDLSPLAKNWRFRRDLSFRLVQQDGREVVSLDPPGMRNSDFAAAQKELARSDFEEGARELVTPEGQAWLASYRRLGGRELMAIGFLPKDAAFEALDLLRRRFAWAGAGILIIGIGIAVVLARRLTARLREIWQATHRIAEGNFSGRVHAPVWVADEVSGLASAFDLMSGRIQELLAATAQKARMQLELETARSLQTRFLPQEAFRDGRFELSGTLLPSTECAGDWWQFSRMGNFLAILIGDVTGHGVSAALLTAAVQGAFLTRIDQELGSPDEARRWLLETMRSLNSATLRSAKGSASLPMTGAILDLRTGELLSANAGHRPPLVLRSGSREFVPAAAGGGSALGEGPDPEVEVSSFRLQEDDLIFWATDGLFECHNTNEQRWPKSLLLDLLVRARDEECSPEQARDRVLAGFSEFLGSAASSLSDDVTLVVGRVPRNQRLTEAV